VCRSDQSTPALQKTIDYACGAGADCTPIIQNGVCYNPDTVVAHCSYAANSYFQRNGQAQTACNFSGTATISTTDPSKFSFPIYIWKDAENRINFHKICIQGPPLLVN
jgi:X8 domain